jgi:hypothetical protein
MPDRAMTLRQQVKIERRTPEYWRAALDNPPLSMMGLEMIAELAVLMGQIEADDRRKVIVFEHPRILHGALRRSRKPPELA